MQPSKPLTLRRNFSWTFVGKSVYTASQWAMLVIIAKLGSPEMVGQFTLGLAVTAPVFMLTNLQLRAIQATDTQQQYFFRDYLGLRLISTALALVVISAITLVAGYPWETLFIIWLVALSKAIESISDVFYGLIQQHERMDRIAMSLMMRGPLSLLMLGIGIYLSGNILGGVIGLAVSWAIVLVSYDIRSGASILNNSLAARQLGELTERKPSAILHPRWHLKTLGKLIELAFPLGLVMMLISLNSNMPRYFIERSLGERELGFFASIAYLMVAGNMVVSALGKSATPRLAKYYAAGNSTAFRQLLIKLVGIGAVLGGLAILVALVAGRQILTLFYQPEYAQHADLLVWLMIAAGIGYISSFLGYGMTAARYFRIQIFLFASTTTTSAVACFWLIPNLGLIGAGFSLLIAAIVQVVISLIIVIDALNKLQKLREGL